MYDDSSLTSCCLGNPLQKTNFRGGLPESISYGVVKLPDAPETAACGNFGKCEFLLKHQIFRKLQMVRPRNL